MKIGGIGYPCMDMGVICGEIPADGGWSPITDMTMQCGGKIPNALAAAARLGAESCIIGTCGTDHNGQKCRQDLEYNGVSCELLQMREGKTGLCICIVDEKERGKRCIETLPEFLKLSAEEIREEELRTLDMLLLYELDETALKAAEIAQKLGIPVLVDGDGFDERTQSNLDKIDIFILSEYYYQHLFGTSGDYEGNLKSLQKQGPETVIVTLGENGCAGISKEGFFREPAFSNVEVVDTTGAGDVFHGAYAFYALQGLPARKAAVHASAVSAIKCARLGGRTGIPTAAGVDAFLKSGSIIPGDFDEREQYYRKLAYL